MQCVGACEQQFVRPRVAGKRVVLRNASQSSSFMSGAPLAKGRAARGLAHLQGRTSLSEPRRSDCIAALQRPQPRVALGLALQGLATAAIDVSDGLLADLGHILEASGVSAQLKIAALPAPTLERDAYLSGGDDYELVFTVPAQARTAVAELATELALPLTRIGSIMAGPTVSIELHDLKGRIVEPPHRGYDHFMSPLEAGTVSPDMSLPEAGTVSPDMSLPEAGTVSP